MNREFSKISCSLFTSRKFKRLQSAEQKLCYVYLLTTPYGNAGGCFEQPVDAGATAMKCSEDEFESHLKALQDGGLIDYDGVEETVFIENWLLFNKPTNIRHAAGVVNHLCKVPSGRLRERGLREFHACFEDLALRWTGDEVKNVNRRLNREIEKFAEPLIPVVNQLRTLPNSTLHNPTQPDTTQPAREIEISEDDADARDVTAAPAPSDGGEEAKGKTTSPSPALKAAAEKLERRTNVRVH